MSLDLSPQFLRGRLERPGPGAVALAAGPDSEAAAESAAGPAPAVRRAAVAILLSEGGADPVARVLLMLRAERSEDRWSGQVSLPGGGAEAGDRDLVATAVRETREEVGLDLASSARLLGALPERRAIALGLVQPLAVQPFVFGEERPAALALGPEAADAFWFPLAGAASGELDSVYPYRRSDGLVRELPCWRTPLPSLVDPSSVPERCIWGMTYFILSELLERARRP